MGQMRKLVFRQAVAVKKPMKKLIATVDDDFAQIDRLLRELRHRIERAAEAVHVVAEKVATRTGSRQPKTGAAKKRSRAVTGKSR